MFNCAARFARLPKTASYAAGRVPPSVEASKLARREARDAVEEHGKMAVTGAADAIGDLGDRHVRLAQQFLRALDAPLEHVAVRRHACGLPERVRKMAGAQRDGVRDRRQRELVAQVLVDVLDCASQLVRRELRFRPGRRDCSPPCIGAAGESRARRSACRRTGGCRRPRAPSPRAGAVRDLRCCASRVAKLSWISKRSGSSAHSSPATVRTYAGDSRSRTTRLRPACRQCVGGPTGVTVMSPGFIVRDRVRPRGLTNGDGAREMDRDDVVRRLHDGVELVEAVQFQRQSVPAARAAAQQRDRARIPTSTHVAGSAASLARAAALQPLTASTVHIRCAHRRSQNMCWPPLIAMFAPVRNAASSLAR